MKDYIEDLELDESSNRLVEEFIDGIETEEDLEEDSEEELEESDEETEEEEEDSEEIPEEDSEERFEDEDAEEFDDIEFLDEPSSANDSEIYSVGNLKKKSSQNLNITQQSSLDKEIEEMTEGWCQPTPQQTYSEELDEEPFWIDLDETPETKIKTAPPIPKVNEILEKQKTIEPVEEVWDENNPKLKMLASLMTLYMRKGNFQSYFQTSNPNIFYSEIYKINLMIVSKIFEFLEASVNFYSYANILTVYKNLLEKLQNIKGKEKKLKYLLVAVIKWKEKYTDRFSAYRTLAQVLTIFDSKDIQRIIAAQKPKISNDDLSGVMAIVFDQVLI